MTGSLLGALAIYLAQNLRLAAHVNIEWVQVVYGAFLIVAVALNAAAGRLEGAASTGGAG